MSCPHSTRSDARPSLCSLCSGASPASVRNVSGVVSVDGLAARTSAVTDGRITRQFMMPNDHDLYGRGDSVDRRQRRRRRRARAA